MQSFDIFFQNIEFMVEGKFVMQGLFKSFVFGGIFSSLSCYFGYHSAGGAKGVGVSVTKAVVYSLVCILFADFLLTYLQLDL